MTQTFAYVWDALTDSPGEAAAMRMRSDLLGAICDTVTSWDVTRALAARRLDLTEARLNELLRGSASRFSFDELIDLATRAGLDVSVRTQEAVRAQRSLGDAQTKLADGLSAEERALLGEAFSALRQERGKAWIDACRRADEHGKRRPGMRSAGIGEIKRLARRFGTKALH